MNPNQTTPNASAAAAQHAAKLTIGVAIFVASKRAIADTLFKPIDGRTASGYFRLRKGGAAFYKPDGTLFAFLVCNSHGERFFVSASIHDGRPVYMFALSTPDETRLGLAGLDYAAQQGAAAKAAFQLGF